MNINHDSKRERVARKGSMSCSVYSGVDVLSYFSLNEPTGGLQRRMSFQLGTGRGFDGCPCWSTTECRKPSMNMAVTSLSSTFASRVPRQVVLPIINEFKTCVYKIKNSTNLHPIRHKRRVYGWVLFFLGRISRDRNIFQDLSECH